MKNIYYNKTIENIVLKNSNRDEVINWLYATHIVEWYTTKLCMKTLEDEDTRDKVQEIYLMVLEIPQDRLDELYEQGTKILSSYIVGLIKKQLVSDTSDIYKKYNRYCQTQLIKNEIFWDCYGEL